MQSNKARATLGERNSAFDWIGRLRAVFMCARARKSSVGISLSGCYSEHGLINGKNVESVIGIGGRNGEKDKIIKIR